MEDMEYLGNIDLLHEALYAIANKKFEYAKELLDICELEKAGIALDFLEEYKVKEAEIVINTLLDDLKQ